MKYASRTARKYARALFSLASEQDALETTVAEIVAAAALLDDLPDLGAALAAQEIPLERRLYLGELAWQTPAESTSDESAEAGPLSELSYHFLCLLIRNRRISLLGEIVCALTEQLDHHQGVVRADITTAVRLLKAEEEMIANKLRELTGASRVELQTAVSKALIGGVIIHLGQHVIDASVRTYLDGMRERLRRVKATDLGQGSLLELNWAALRGATDG